MRRTKERPTRTFLHDLSPDLIDSCLIREDISGRINFTMRFMAIPKAPARLILREHARYQFSGPVLCLGVPDIYVSESELDAELGRARPGRSADFVSPSTFFGGLGLTELTSIDIPGSTHEPDLIHDLNRPFPSPLVGKFGLVVDPGTTEHVFDTSAALTNIASALRVGGVVIHFVPIYSYNGGYYSINPNVLNDFYALNGFSDQTSYIIMWDRYRPFANKSRCYRYTPQFEIRHGLADRDQCRFTPHLLFFARKENVVSEYRSPIQQERHEVDVRRTSAPKALARRWLPEEVITWLAAKRRRDRQLRDTRRDSFLV